MTSKHLAAGPAAAADDDDDDDLDINLEGVDVSQLNLDDDDDDDDDAADAAKAIAAAKASKAAKAAAAAAGSAGGSGSKHHHHHSNEHGDGDEDGEEDGEGDDDEDDEEDDDEEDEEPKLKYQRVSPGMTEMLKQDAASCLAVHDKFLALGTHFGMIYILDFSGNEIKRFPAHTGTITDLSIDGNGDYIASSSDDGKVVINALFAAEGQQVFTYKRPVKAVSLDPDFSRKNTRQLVSGGLAGQLTLNEKGWFGNKDIVLHAGEGPIYAIKWAATFIAWANDSGVKIYDTTTKQRITFIERPKGSPRPDLYHCCLSWKSDTELLIGWADSVKVARIREKARGATVDAAAPSRYAEIVCMFQTDYFICGIAPFEGYLVILAYMEDAADSNDPKAVSKKVAQRPEMRIVTYKNEDISSDALPVNGFEVCQANDYRLEYIASDNLFYVVSPKDIVLARPRDLDDHISWLLDRLRYDEALAAAEKNEAQLTTHKVLDIGQKYIQHLINIGDFEGAARICPQVLRANKSLWEHWAYLFMEIRQYKALCPFIPIDDPKLSPAVYEMVLHNILNEAGQAQTFLKTIREWPSDLYNIQTIISAVLDKLTREPNNTVLMDALADLYTRVKQYSQALQILLRLRRGNVFELIKKHNLFDVIQDKIVALMQFDDDKQAVAAAAAVTEVKEKSKYGEDDDIEGRPAVSMLIKNTDRIPIATVVNQLKNQPRLCHIYLNALFQKDPHVGSQFHEMQVELYAEYDRTKLLPFLRQSNYYPLERALKICQDRDLVPEMVFILGRMGNNKQALSLIIEKLRDVEQAIDFAKEQNDDELWEDLIKYSMDKPVFIIGLLQNVGSHVDPIKLITRIPKGLRIPGLREALIKILQDYNLQMSLREGCRQILSTDCVSLLEKLHKEQSRGYLVEESTMDASSHRYVFQEGSKNSIVVFYCGHTFFEQSLSAQISAGKSMSHASDLFCPLCLSSQTRRAHGDSSSNLYRR